MLGISACEESLHSLRGIDSGAPSSSGNRLRVTMDDQWALGSSWPAFSSGNRSCIPTVINGTLAPSSDWCTRSAIVFGRTFKVSHDHGWRGACAARSVTDVIVGSGVLFDSVGLGIAGRAAIFWFENEVTRVAGAGNFGLGKNRCTRCAGSTLAPLLRVEIAFALQRTINGRWTLLGGPASCGSFRVEIGHAFPM